MCKCEHLKTPDLYSIAHNNQVRLDVNQRNTILDTDPKNPNDTPQAPIYCENRLDDAAAST